MSDTDIIDPAAHERLLEWGGSKLLREMVRLFLENSGERMQLIATGFAEADARKVEHGAHSLKSSAANVGAERVRGFAMEMEERASRGDLRSALELHEGLTTALGAATARLRELQPGREE